MARVTVEDCIDKVENRFDLVLLASHRARMISSGSQITIERDNDKNPVVALREIAETTISPDDLKEELVHSLAEIRRGRRARARGCSADRRGRRHGRRRRHRGHRRPDDRGRAAQGPGRAHSARGAARGRRIEGGFSPDHCQSRPGSVRAVVVLGTMIGGCLVAIAQRHDILAVDAGRWSGPAQG